MFLYLTTSLFRPQILEVIFNIFHPATESSSGVLQKSTESAEEFWSSDADCLEHEPSHTR